MTTRLGVLGMPQQPYGRLSNSEQITSVGRVLDVSSVYSGLGYPDSGPKRYQLQYGKPTSITDLFLYPVTVYYNLVENDANSVSINIPLDITGQLESFNLTENSANINAGLNISGQIELFSLTENPGSIDIPNPLSVTAEAAYFNIYENIALLQYGKITRLGTLLLPQKPYGSFNKLVGINISGQIQLFSLTENDSIVYIGLIISADRELFNLTENDASIQTVTPWSNRWFNSKWFNNKWFNNKWFNSASALSVSGQTNYLTLAENDATINTSNFQNLWFNIDWFNNIWFNDLWFNEAATSDIDIVVTNPPLFIVEDNAATVSPLASSYSNRWFNNRWFNTRWFNSKWFNIDANINLIVDSVTNFSLVENDAIVDAQVDLNLTATNTLFNLTENDALPIILGLTITGQLQQFNIVENDANVILVGLALEAQAENLEVREYRAILKIVEPFSDYINIRSVMAKISQLPLEMQPESGDWLILLDVDNGTIKKVNWGAGIVGSTTYTVTDNQAIIDLNATYTNNGATKNIILNLPQATPGNELIFRRDASYTMTLDPDISDYFTTPAGAAAPGAFKRLDTDGAYIHLKCYVNNAWQVITTYGTITDE